MKKRAAVKKPSARKGAAKKQTKATTPAKASSAAAGAADRTGVGKYTPTPIQGIGWAPFRYPL
jgi:hypothetical protein